MFKKHLFVILPEKDYVEDKYNKIRSFNKNDVYFYAGYNNLETITELVNNNADVGRYLKNNPPFFCEVNLFSIVLPIKKLKLKLDNKIMLACFYKNKFILVPNEHLHKINTKYKYVCAAIYKS